MGKISKLAALTAVLLAGTASLAAKPVTHATAHAMAAGGMTRIMGKPNLNGIWQVMNGADHNLEPHSASEAKGASDMLGALGATPASLGVVEGGMIPYKPDALKQRDTNRAGAPKADPEAACYLPGIPRATYVNHPFQIIQSGNDDILMAYEYDTANRVVHMQKVEVPPIDTWMGTSYGAWEGDTLKVVTLGQNGMTWLDRSGNYASGGATVTERFKMIDANHIMYEAVIDDPSVYSKPWKISMPLYRRMEANAQLLDFNCVPFADMVVYGDLYKDKDKYPKK